MVAVARELSAPHYSTLPRDREPRFVPGSLLAGGDLEVVCELARGGMSVVYRAIDHRGGGRLVALKIVTAEVERWETEARYRNEARLGASLSDHPHVVSPLRVGQLDGPEGFEGRMYLVTELVEGQSLDWVMSGHPLGLEPERACRLARDVAVALVDLHERGIVHRDIKPGNVLVTAEAPTKAMLIDFGLAYATGDGWEAASPDLTQEGQAPGTLLYMSPQQAVHERPEPAMDIYAFGVMLYELLSGSPPHDRVGNAELLARKCDRNRSPYPLNRLRPTLDGRLISLVERCLRFDPEARPRAEEVLHTLDEVLGATPPSRRWGRVLGLAGLLVCVPVGLGFVDWGRTVPESAHVEIEPPAAAAAPYARADRETTPAGIAAKAKHGEPAVVGVTPSSVEAPRAALAMPGDARPAPRARPDGHRAKAQGESTQRHEAPPETAADRCTEVLRDTQKAEQRRQWGRVLRLTKRGECWANAPGDRTWLRTKAFFETGRYAECAAEGCGASDPDVARWASICEANRSEPSP